MGVSQPDRSGSRRRCDRTRAGAARFVLLAAASFAVAAPATATAATTAEATAAATTVSQGATVPSGWTGSTGTCTTGTESQASLDATLQAVNAFRSVAGLAPVSFDPTLSQQALSAALMMKAANNLSHDPDPSWACYSPEGDDAAGRSNLALGSSGAAAIRLYVADEGIAGLGHRRWVLDPSATVFGSGSTGTSNALMVIGGASQFVASGAQVAWPPPGAIAASWVPTTWSVSVGGTGDAVNLAAPQVTMTLDGAPVAVTQISDIGTGYGTGRGLSWVPTLDRTALRSGYHELGVSVSGFTVNGVAEPVAFTTTVGTAPAPTPTPSPTTATSSAATTTVSTLPRLRPRISRGRGKLKPGMHVTASFAQGTGRIVTKVQWLRSGKVIKRANSVRLKVTASDRGRTLRVKVWSQAKTGGSQLVEQSAALKVPRK
ncbi:MAG: CAP domain-containing protein [Solirubrobacteraceae bacterium]|nr:CAP domain-containing protein [Solirubrobacteraceae bacterium]